MRPAFLPSLLLFAAGAVLGCDPGPMSNARVRAIAVTAPTTQLRPGDFLRATANPLDASGNVVEGVTATWRSLTPATLDVNEDGLMLALAPGLGIARATARSVSTELRLDLVNPPIATLKLEADTLRLVLPGGQRSLGVDVRDAGGVGIIGAPLTWESSASRIVPVTTGGVVTAVAVGQARITVRGDGREASTLVIVEAPPGPTSPVISALAPTVAVPGQTMVVSGNGFSATRTANTVMIDGIPIPVSAATATQLTLALPVASAFPCLATRTVALQVATSGGIGVAPVTLQVANPVSLAVGQSLVVNSAVESRCNELAPAAGRYVITLPNAARAIGGATMSFELHGDATPAAGALMLDAAAIQQRNLAATNDFARRTKEARALQWSDARSRRQRARDAAHFSLLEADRDIVDRARRAAPELRAEGAPALLAPTLGSVVPVRIPNLGQANFCDNYVPIGARAVYVGEHVVVLEDTGSVIDGQPTTARQMDDDYAALGAEMDAAGWAAVRTFGNPLVMDSRLDDNGRVMLVFTPRMNQKLGGSILASVVNCDLFSRAQFNSSNVGEYLYAQVPTTLAPGMAPGTRGLWRHEMRATIVHELKHVTSFAERIVAGRPLEESWLEEATARDAEEVYGRTVYGVARASNAGFDATLTCELRADDPAYPACAGAPRALRPHFEALWDFLASPATRSPLGPVEAGDFSFYGSGWALTRWLVDQEGLAETTFFTGLTTSSQSGVANLEGRTGRTWDEMLPQWSLAMATDDRSGLVPASPRVRFPAWDLRSVYQGFCDVLGSCIVPPAVPSRFTRSYPVQTLALEAGSFAAEFGSVVPGGFVAVELTVTAATPRQAIEVRGYRGGSYPAGVRLAIMRVE